MPDIYDEIKTERARQVELGWTPEHDDEHGVLHLVILARKYTLGISRQGLIKTAALLVAAIEVIDRKSSADSA